MCSVVLMPLTITLIFSRRMVAILCLTQCATTQHLNINNSIGFKTFYALIQKHIHISNLVSTIKICIIYNMALVYWSKYLYWPWKQGEMFEHNIHWYCMYTNGSTKCDDVCSLKKGNR
jgi:hypothetical protein